MKKKFDKIVWSCTLIAVFALLINNTVYVHTHFLPDGKVVQHAHPFNSSGEESGSQPHHKHTSKEFLLLSYVYELFSNSVIYFIVIIFLLKCFSQHTHFGGVTLFPSGIKKVKTPRAPPQLLLSLNSNSHMSNYYDIYYGRNSNEKNSFMPFDILLC